VSVEREVKIYGQVYRVRGDNPERIGRVAAHVDKMMTDLLGGPGHGLSTKGAVLTALNVAEEGQAYRDEVDQLLHNVRQRMEELLGLLPE
jgi:cell division protein ZapA (FtsZ GTPase activity inhibitor)